MKRTLVIFSDLDGTMIPLRKGGEERFIQFVKEVKERENADVKVCLISGRPADYVQGRMDALKDRFEEHGLNDVFVKGSGEHGAVIFDGKNNYEHKYIGDKKRFLKFKSGRVIDLKEYIAELLKQHEFGKYLALEDGKKFTATVKITGEGMNYINMLGIQESVIFKLLSDFLRERLPERINIVPARDCIEVMDKSINKANGVDRILKEIEKDYDILGVAYAGDSDNDRPAMEYLVKRAKDPNTNFKINVYTPRNARPAVSSETIEGRMVPYYERVIKKANQPIFKGILDLANQDLNRGKLIKDSFIARNLSHRNLVNTNNLSSLRNNSNRTSRENSNIGLVMGL